MINTKQLAIKKVNLTGRLNLSFYNMNVALQQAMKTLENSNMKGSNIDGYRNNKYLFLML